MWFELLNNYDMIILYLLSNTNVVVDSLIRISMGINAHSEEGNTNFTKKVHRLVCLEIYFLDSSEGWAVVINKVESSLVSEVKEKQDKDPSYLK